MADIIAIIATVYKTYGTIKISREANVQATFSSILLRAGEKPELIRTTMSEDHLLFQVFYISGTPEGRSMYTILRFCNM